MIKRILTCAIRVVFVTMVTSTHFLCGMLQVGAWRVETAPRYHTHCEEPCPVKTRSVHQMMAIEVLLRYYILAVSAYVLTSTTGGGTYSSVCHQPNVSTVLF